jgi:hypothetical protein
MSISDFVSAWREFPRQWLIGLGIPQRTVDDYRAGKAPVDWTRSRIIDALRSESKKHNKTPQGNPARRSKER